MTLLADNREQDRDSAYFGEGIGVDAEVIEIGVGFGGAFVGEEANQRVVCFRIVIEKASFMVSQLTWND